MRRALGSVSVPSLPASLHLVFCLLPSKPMSLVTIFLYFSKGNLLSDLLSPCSPHAPNRHAQSVLVQDAALYWN